MSCLLQTYCCLSIIEKLFISSKFFETYGIINYGRGWRKDVVNHCSDRSVTWVLPYLALVDWCRLCCTDLLHAFLHGCLYSCITYQTGGHHINVLWQIFIQCYGSEILWIKPLIHLTTINVLTAEFLHNFLELFVKAISFSFNSSQNEVNFRNGYRPLKTWVCISMSKISKQQVK